MNNLDIGPILLSTKLAVLTSIILLVICLPLALILAKSHPLIRRLTQTFSSLTMVLPPTVLGFYLLLLLNQESWIGKAYYHLTGGQLVFHFSGLLIGSVVFCFPFALRPLFQGAQSLDKKHLEAAAVLGLSPLQSFLNVTLPLMRYPLLSSAIFTFTTTLGEFGVVLMLGGNIPGKTRTISVALYDEVEQMNYSQAHSMAAILLSTSFLLLFLLSFLEQRQKQELSQ